MRIRISVGVAAVLLAVTTVVSAQTTGTLNGRLTDTQGLAVPGATVTVNGPQGSKSEVSDGEGRFSVPFLTPGTYDVRAELQGFKAVDVRGATVSLGQTTDLLIKMEVGGLTETVEVTSSTVVVDTSSTTTGAILSEELLSRVPVGRRFTDALYLAPGVSSGGSVGSANPSVSGGSGLDNLYVIDGVNVTNTGYGAVGSYSIIFGSLGSATPFDFIKEIQVKTGGYEAEFGQSLGGVVNVVTKSGSNSVRGSVFGYTQPESLEGTFKTFQSANGTVNTVSQHRSDIGFEVGGPILRNRLFFFGAYNPGWETRTFIAPDGFPLTSLGEVDRERQLNPYSAKVTYQLASSHRVDASFFGDPSHGKLGLQRTSALLVQNTSSFSELDYGGHNQTVRYDGVLTPNLLLESSYARAYNNIAETPTINEWRVTDQTVTPNIITGGIGGYEAGNKGTNHQYTAKLTYILRDHSIKGGFLYEDVEYSQVNQNTGPTFTAPDGTQTATGARLSILNDVNFGRIYRVTRANFNTERLTTQNYQSFFVQDQWKVNNRLTINAGLRYEQQSLLGTFEELTTTTGDTLGEFALNNNWGPRVGAIYDILGNGRSKIYGNWGRFYARIPNDLAARALSGDAGFTRGDYFDANLTRPIPNGVVTQVPGASPVTQHYIVAGLGADLIDPETKLSYQDEFVGGFEVEAFPNTNVGIRYIHRNIGRVLEDIAPYSVAACDFGVADACSTDYILTNPGVDTPATQVAGMLPVAFEDPKHVYDAVELTMDRRFSGGWTMLGSYRYSRLFGTFEGFFREDNGQSDPGITSLYDFPTNDPNYTALGYRGDIRFLGELGEGRLPLDRPHQIKVSGNRTFDRGLGLGVRLSLSSGKPLTALAANPNYNNSSEIPETPRGEGFDTFEGFKERTPFETQVDLQASYVLNFGTRKLTLLADAFNLFNIRRVTDYNAATEIEFDSPNPDFGTPTSDNVAGQQYQFPFQLRLGARFSF
ncbi:MAG: TonB-dependent receptor [Acidobacteria bacterium]|nr:TonB-dependent receptor [Acidobacteriota bacterium]